MSGPKSLYVLSAPVGQLAGNGQLRETISERRNRKGKDVAFWYLSPDLVEKFKLPGNGVEAVVAEDSKAIDWLKLRFGGERFTAELDVEELHIHAGALPPPPIHRDISSN